MDGVFARSVVNVTYQNGDAYLGDEASVQKPEDTSAQIIICKSEGGNNVYTSPLNMQTIQPEISNPNTPKKKGAGAPVRTGSLVLNHIMRFCEDISVEGMLPHQKAIVKKNKLHAFVTGQFPAGSSFKKEECTGNNDFIGFDLDDTEIPLKALLNVFRGRELLHYTTISDDENSSQRRYRIVVACTRTMNLGEHQRIMSHYQSKIEKLAKALGVKHGLDPSKLKAYSKFFMPHGESQKEHLKSRRKPLDVDHLLSTIPLTPIVVSPTADDLDYKEPAVTNSTGAQVIAMNPVMDNCRRLINQMGKGNRSNLAVKVGGMAKHLSPAEKDELFASMLAKGVDKSAMNSARKYANRT